jgi:hypothetical protein
VKVKTNKGLELEFTPEELRHFKLNTPEDVRGFIDKMEEKGEVKVGFVSQPQAEGSK